MRVAVILAGGRSSRFGCDKVFADFHGRPLITHLTTSLENAGFEIVLAGPKAKLDCFGFPVLEDETPFQGPLAVLDGVWRRTSSERIFFAACDMPFLSPHLLAALWERSAKGEIALLEDSHGPSPLPGVYHRTTASMIAELRRQGRHDLKALLACKLKVNTIAMKTPLLNINTPDQVREGIAMARERCYGTFHGGRCE